MFAYLFLLAAMQDPDPVVTPTPKPAEKQVCRQLTRTGSRLGGSRVCRTQAEWDRMAAQAAEDLRLQGQQSPK